MKLSIPWSLVGRLVGYILSMLPIETVHNWCDSLIDKAEKSVQGKPWEAPVMAACATLRAILNTPDEPGEDQSNPV